MQRYHTSFGIILCALGLLTACGGNTGEHESIAPPPDPTIKLSTLQQSTLTGTIAGNHIKVADSGTFTDGVSYVTLTTTAQFSEDCGPEETDLDCESGFEYALVLQCTKADSSVVQWVACSSDYPGMVPNTITETGQISGADCQASIDFDGSDNDSATALDNYTLSYHTSQFPYAAEADRCSATWLELDMEKAAHKIIDQLTFTLKKGCDLTGACS